VDSGAQQAEEKDGYCQKKKAAHLATAFGLPASCCNSRLLWHEFGIFVSR
jgi:hypothetical protein